MQTYIIIAVIAVVVIFILVRRKSEPEVEEKPAAVSLPTVKAETAFSSAAVEEGVSPAIVAAITAAVTERTYPHMDGRKSIVAAITAAVTLVTGQPASAFKFKSIRPVGSAQPMSMWAFMGTADIMSTRQSYLERRGN